MAQRRLKVQKLKDIIRLKHQGLSDQQVASALKISKGSVNKIYRKFKVSGASWPPEHELNDNQWYGLIYPPKTTSSSSKPKPDYEKLAAEYLRPGVTIQLLWEEYQSENGSAIGRTVFYSGFKKHLNKNNISMTMMHKGGDKLFVDYSGDSFFYIDKKTGEKIKTELFVATMGASSFTYAEVTASQKKEDWVASHIRAFEFFGGLPNAVVPDNLKSAVTKPSLYEPDINPLYAKMAEHYDIAILPARVRKPQDKGIVESNVLCVQRRILAALRDCIFHSLSEINDAIRIELQLFNSRGMKDHGGLSRQERFATLDAPWLKPIQVDRFAITSLKLGVRVQKNYHIEFEKHYYSCPYTLVGELVDVHQSGPVLELYHKGDHICRHQKMISNYGYETKDEHMPKSHQITKGYSPAWFICKGGEVGVHTSELIKQVLNNKRHPEQAYKSSQGILSLEKKYSKERLEQACRRAIFYKSYSYKAVQSILEKSLDTESLFPSEESETVLLHANIRGPEYYSISKAQGDQ